MSLKRQELEVCCECKLYCEEISQVNTIGVRKSYCCECYSKIDKNYIFKKWCNACKDTFNIRS